MPYANNADRRRDTWHENGLEQANCGTVLIDRRADGAILENATFWASHARNTITRDMACQIVATGKARTLIVFRRAVRSLCSTHLDYPLVDAGTEALINLTLFALILQISRVVLS